MPDEGNISICNLLNLGRIMENWSSVYQRFILQNTHRKIKFYKYWHHSHFWAVAVKDQNMSPWNMLLGPKAYFELKATEKQQIQKEISALPICLESRMQMPLVKMSSLPTTSCSRKVATTLSLEMAPRKNPHKQALWRRGRAIFGVIFFFWDTP